MDALNIEKSTKDFIATFPGLESFLAATLKQFTDAANQIATNATAALADGVTQIVGIGLAVDGAEIEMEIEPIVIPAIKAKWTVRMPLKPLA